MLRCVAASRFRIPDLPLFLTGFRGMRERGNSCRRFRKRCRTLCRNRFFEFRIWDSRSCRCFFIFLCIFRLGKMQIKFAFALGLFVIFAFVLDTSPRQNTNKICFCTRLIRIFVIRRTGVDPFGDILTIRGRSVPLSVTHFRKIYDLQ